MYRLMRNVHLGLGLVFALVALLFGVSSLVIVYRPLLRSAAQSTETTVQLSARPRRALARLPRVDERSRLEATASDQERDGGHAHRARRAAP
jgi:hypothetical protein